MEGAELFLERLGPWPQRIALALAALWGLAAGLMFVFAGTGQAWVVFIGGYQTILLVTAIATVLSGAALRRGEWNRALALGIGTMLAVTAIYLLAVALAAAPVPHGLIALDGGVRLQRKPDMMRIAPGFLLGSMGLGAVLGPGFLLFSPVRTQTRRGVRELRAPALRPPAALFRATGDPYQPGLLRVRSMCLRQGERAAPTELVIHTPTVPGQYPVVLFQHGFLLRADRFSGLLQHLASHGFVVVAPQMYAPHRLPISAPNSLAEAELAERIVDWMPTQLSAVAGVNARTDALGVAGHSRGAKVAWWLVKRGYAPIRALVGVDPVDSAIPFAGDPRVLDGSFIVAQPTLVIGTELGQVVRGPFTPPAAPTGRNHLQFFAACAGPAWHALLRGHGHLDMLDDKRPGPFVSHNICLRGADPAGAQRTTAGLLTAFFRTTLQDDAAAACALDQPDAAPVPVLIRIKPQETTRVLRAA